MKLENKSKRQLKKQYWDLLSKLIRLEYPKCQLCEQQNSTEVHHIIKRSKGNSVYFFRDNLISLCRSCHYKWHNHWSEKEKYKLLELPERVKSLDLPEVQVINSKGKPFSEEMEREIKNTLEGKNPSRVILFLNRRGYAPFARCYNCGWTARCEDCDISLTFHKQVNILICHQCGNKQSKPENCPNCGKEISYLGWGTEKIEEEIEKKYKDFRIKRMDTDSTSGRHSHEEIYNKLKKGEIEILLGTQMVTKGLDFPDIGFVGVISADTSLNLPDFRATEKTFQLLSQVAGRAGRGREGKVLIQSSNPNHYAIKSASEHKYLDFYKEEIKFREEANYPPFTRLARILIKSKDFKKTEQTAAQIKGIIAKMNKEKEVSILGPVICPIGRIEKYYRFHILLKSKKVHILNNILLKLYEKKFKNTKISLEIDPINML